MELLAPWMLSLAFLNSHVPPILSTCPLLKFSHVVPHGAPIKTDTGMQREGCFLRYAILEFFTLRNLKLRGDRTMAWEWEIELCTDDLISWEK